MIKHSSFLKSNLKMILFFLGFLNFFSSTAQSDTTKYVVSERIVFDTIKFVNGSKQAAKIIEVGEKVVKYKNPKDTLGPTFVVKKKDVEGFVLKNGCLEMESLGFVNCVKDPMYGNIKEQDFTRILVGVDLLALINKHLRPNINYIFKDRRAGIGLTADYGIPDGRMSTTYSRFETKLFSSNFYKQSFIGIDYKLFPGLHKKFTYFIGFGFDYGNAWRLQRAYTPSYYYPIPNVLSVYTYSWKNTYHPATFIAYNFNNGFIYRITKNDVFQIVVNLGATHYRYSIKEKTQNTFFAKITVMTLWGFAF